MDFSIKLTIGHLRVLSSLITDLSAGWFLAIFVAKDPLVLTMNLIAAILCLLIAFKLENILEIYD